MICMAKIKCHLYGLIPAKFIKEEIDIPDPVNLEKLECEIVKMFGQDIHEDYLNDRGLLNHQIVRAGDSAGNRLNYESDISGIDEIWFIVPISGG